MDKVSERTTARRVSSGGRDRDFAARVMAHPDARKLTACLSCGSCAAGCPIHDVFPAYSPKRIARMVRLGMREEVLRAPHLWYCTTCRTCEDRCPQKVPFFRILNVLKNMAAEEGCAPPAWIEQTKQVMRSGRVFPEENSKDHPLMKMMLETSEIARFARDGGSP